MFDTRLTVILSLPTLDFDRLESFEKWLTGALEATSPLRVAVA
jgi:hypothetical protein